MSALHVIQQWLWDQDTATILTLIMVTSFAVLFAMVRFYQAFEGRCATTAAKPLPPVVHNLGVLATRCELAAKQPSLDQWERISLRIQADTYRDAQLAFLENPRLESQYIETSLTMGGMRRG